VYIMKKRYIAIFLMIVLAFSLVGCNDTNKPTDNNIVEEENNNGNKPVETTSETNKKEVTLYFANKEYIETGDESLEKLIGEKRVIEYEDISLEEAIIKELIKGPESDKLNTVIPPDVVLLDVKVTDGTAYVNFAGDGLNGGSLQEEFTLNQIIKSLIELDNIERVQFLIDGEKAESLMGHYEISEPFEDILD
jgi:spore germination protein GerM